MYVYIGLRKSPQLVNEFNGLKGCVQWVHITLKHRCIPPNVILHIRLVIPSFLAYRVKIRSLYE